MSEIIERDIIQARLLNEIFSRTLKRQVVLKGGMAFRASLGSQRYTKDIDLSQQPGMSLPALQRIMRVAIASSAKGFLKNLVVTELKQTDTVARWKIHGETNSGSHVGFTVEVSRQGFPDDHIIEARSDAAQVKIDVYDNEALAASKVFALASASRVAPRDLYDLDLLVEMSVSPDPKLFSTVSNPSEFVESIWQKVDLMTWGLFKDEVLPFLSESARSRIKEEDFDAMKLRVGDAVEEWSASWKI